MEKQGSNLAKAIKIAISIISFLLFLCVAFCVITYYLGGKSYLYHSQEVVYDFYLACVAVLAATVIMIILIITMFKSRNFFRAISTFLITVSIPVFAYASFLGIIAIPLFGTNGCSYTEDIQNYGKYDEYAESFAPSFFPESITDEMNVVKYVYFDKYVDIEQTDFFLEISFENKDTMDKYLTKAKEQLLSNSGTSKSRSELFEYQNPYDNTYTDVIECYYSNDKWCTSNEIEFTDEDYQSVDMRYSVISYSYDDLTIIYSKTFLTSGDILYGDDPDSGDYYAAYFKRFNVEFDVNNSLSEEDLINMALDTAK